VLILAAMAFGAVTLARPALRIPVPKDRATIILVLDVSGSMGASDMFPSRLAAAKRAAETFVDTLPDGFRVGVVAFSSEATLVHPVTDDLPAARAAIEQLQLGGGTAIGEGLDVALAALPPELIAPPGAIAPLGPTTGASGQPLQPGQPPPPPPAVVLLLTDGANTEGVPPLEATARARDINIPVFTIGMGGRGGFPFGGGARGSIDETLLQEMAAQTGGQYYYAPTGGDLRRVYNDLGVALGWDFERREIGQYFAATAILLGASGLVLAFLWLNRQP